MSDELSCELRELPELYAVGIGIWANTGLGNTPTSSNPSAVVRESVRKWVWKTPETGESLSQVMSSQVLIDGF